MEGSDIHIGITELRQHLRDYVSEAGRGRRVFVERGSKEVAVLLSADLLKSAGSPRPHGKGSYKLPKIDRVRVEGELTASEALEELRSFDRE